MDTTTTTTEEIPMAMTVAQLIAKLSTLPGDAEVLFDLGDEYISVENVDCSDPDGEDEQVAVFMGAATDRYMEEERDGVFGRFIG